MRRVGLDDVLGAATALEGVVPSDQPAQVRAWLEGAHLADAVRKRLGTRRAARFGPPGLGARAGARVGFASSRAGHQRLAVVLRVLEEWRAAQARRGGCG